MSGLEGPAFSLGAKAAIATAKRFFRTSEFERLCARLSERFEARVPYTAADYARWAESDAFAAALGKYLRPPHQFDREALVASISPLVGALDSGTSAESFARMIAEAIREELRLAKEGDDLVRFEADRVIEALERISGPGPGPPPYLNRIAEIRNTTPTLRDRGEWLRSLQEFATGSEGYRWIVGPPRAGKSALAAHLFDRCGPNVDCVAYFLERRLADADSGRFMTVVSTQLAWLLGEAPPIPADDFDSFLGLWRKAINHAEQSDSHVLLIVDGLDEDLSRELGRPSVAAVLPALVGTHAHVLVTSRRLTDLPPDVAMEHPLRARAPVELPTSAHAARTTEAADLELRLLLERADDLGYACIALLAAAEGALSVDDFSELLARGEDHYRLDQVERVLTAGIARVLERTGMEPDARYAFADDELRARSEHATRRERNELRARFHEWADAYAQLGWEERTPTYLLDAYPTMLARHEPQRLVALVKDFRYIETVVARLGLDNIMTMVGAAERHDAGLGDLRRCLEQQGHHLRSAEEMIGRGLVTRQLCLQALTLGYRELADRAQGQMLAMGLPQLVPERTSAVRSPALMITLPTACGAAALSRHAETALTGGGLWGKSGDLRRWDLSTPNPPGELLGQHSTYVVAVALDGKGARAVTASASDAGHGELLGWQFTGNTSYCALMNRPMGLRSVAISTDGDWAIGCTAVTGLVATWDMTNPESTGALLNREGPRVGSVAISAAGDVAVGIGPNVLFRWELREGVPTRVHRWDLDDLGVVAINADGRLLVAGGQSGRVVFCKFVDGGQLERKEYRISEQSSDVGAVALSADGARALIGSGRDLLCWDRADPGPRVRRLPGHTREVQATAITPDGNRAITGSAAEALVWDLTVPAVAPGAPLWGPDGWVHSVDITGDGRTAITGGGDVYRETSELRLWNMAAGPPTSTLLSAEPGGLIESVAISTDGSRALTAGRGVHLWDLSVPSPAGEWICSGSVAAMSADGGTVIAADGMELVMRDLSHQDRLSVRLEGHNGPVTALALSADGSSAITAARTHYGTRAELLLWDLAHEQSGPLVLPVDASEIRALALSRDGRYALSGGQVNGHAGASGNLLCWDLSADRPMGRSLVGHTTAVRAVGISNDGRRGFSAGGGELKVWDLISGTPTETYVDGLITALSVAEYACGESLILTAEWAGALTQWRVLTSHSGSVSTGA